MHLAKQKELWVRDFFTAVSSSLIQFTILDLIDIVIVAFIVYGLLKVASKTRAMQVLKGLGLIIVMASVSELLNLATVSWFMNAIITSGIVIVVILFQPEIRRVLEKIGRGKIFDKPFHNSEISDYSGVVDELHRAVLNMSKRKIGALIVFERKTGLADVIESGTTLDAKVSAQVIENVFFPNSPLHDGAMIVKDDRIVAAGCFLPLSDNKQLSSELGTRHRAALGISEISDSITIIVSEETGVISKTLDGTLTRYIDSKALRELLSEMMSEKQGKSRLLGNVLRRKGDKK